MTTISAATAEMETRDSGRRSWNLPCALSAGVTIFGIRAFFLIQHSLVNGRLSAPLTDDDVWYLGDSLRRIASLRSDGLWATIQGLVEHPPHSPISTLIGAVAFMSSGSASFAPYLANALLLGSMLGLLVHLLRAPLVLSIGIIACAALLPLTDWAIMTFRPDIMAGIFTACICGILLASDINRMSVKHTALMGMAGGLCLLYKPTAFLPTGVLLATALASAIVKAKRSATADVSAQQTVAAVLIGTGAVTCLPYFIPAAPELLRYIHFAMLQNTSITGLQGGWLEQIAFYPEQALQMFGQLSWLVFAIVPIAIFSCKSERITMICLTSVVFVAYIIPTIPTVKTVMFGSYFYGAVLVCFIATLSLLARRLPRSMAVGLAAIVALQLVWRREDQPAVYAAFMKVYRTISLQTYQEINDQSLKSEVQFYLGFPWPLGPGVLELKSMQDRQPYQIEILPNPLYGYFKEDLQSYIDDLKRSQLALIPSAELVGHFSQRLPAERFLDQTLQYARNDSRFKLIDKIDTDWGPAYLFRNTAPSRIEPASQI
jgi:hypothetical protein